jgi:hypothetical protein
VQIPAIVAAALAVLAQASGDQAGANPPTPGTVTVELAGDRAGPSGPDPVFAEAVEKSLGDANFLALPAPSHSRYIAEVAVTQDVRRSVASDGAEAPASTHFGDWSARLDVTMPSKKTELHGLVVTELTVRIVLRSTNRTVWSGSALTARAQGTPAGAARVVAGALADAVIRRFPDKLDGPITVP